MKNKAKEREDLLTSFHFFVWFSPSFIFGYRDELDRLKAAQYNELEAQKRQDQEYVQNARTHYERASQMERQQKDDLKRHQNSLVSQSLMDQHAFQELQREKKLEEVRRFQEQQRLAQAQEEEAKRSDSENEVEIV